MHKLQVMLYSALFSAALLTSTSIVYAAEASAEVQTSDVPAPDAVNPETTAPENQGAAAQSSDAQDTVAPTESADPYAVKFFFADFTHFTIGDIVPELYRSKKYEVVQWKIRNLPAPEADSHWTYMGGNYVMITNTTGKILKAESGEIFYSK